MKTTIVHFLEFLLNKSPVISFTYSPGSSFLTMLGRKAIAASLTWALSISSVYSAPSAAMQEREVADHEVTFQTIYVPPSDYNTPKTLYGRTVQLEDGTLLATW